ncbi:MAG: DnaA regulatory inactivator Hda [Aquabacterium sp.]
MRQLPLPLAPPAQPGLEGFVEGGNGAVLAHLAALQPGSAPVYLWGPVGCGKTHLLRALASAWQRDGLGVGWFDAADALPWNLSEGWALMVLDSCHTLDDEHQQAAFALCGAPAERGVTWVAAGQMPPVDLPLRDDLRTRLGWGPAFALQPLGEAEARAAMRREADRRGVLLSDEVMDYLLTRFDRNLAHLMPMLSRLDAFALAEQRRLTIPLLKKMLAEPETA